MSAPDKTPEKETKPSKPEITVLVKVLKNGVRAGGGKSAKNKVLQLKESDAKFHEEQGNVAIIGTP